MDNQQRGFFSNTKFAISTGILAFIVVAVCLAVFLIAQTIRTFAGNNEFPATTITVMGEGEIVAIPDIATFTYTVSEVAETVGGAQTQVAERNNKILELLKGQDIEDRDIKTISYNIHPRYEWQSEIYMPGQPSRGGRNILIGQEVSQSVEVRVRDISEAGNVLSLIGGQQVSNVSSLRFTIDDESTLRAEARAEAIQDAKQKADTLAKELGVKIKKVVSFNEDRDGYYPMGWGGDRMMMEASSADMKIQPEIPAGENIIKTQVHITFEIRG